MSQSNVLASLSATIELPRTVECGRCGGRGTLPVFRHVEGGICFACRGAKRLVVRG